MVDKSCRRALGVLSGDDLEDRFWSDLSSDLERFVSVGFSGSLLRSSPPLIDDSSSDLTPIKLDGDENNEKSGEGITRVEKRVVSLDCNTEWTRV
ncbi:hypothetical protein L1987_14591 [Smallanthus sonchifolius]|uniref:Uncharacterized protein n=1 Tax=Smallanthus sonchifolius TaxID=185202 RepID=A0ACB9J3M7_9ASTR|nr:hypothetical protein L1987_14591 [Smallanthus sonchifolius]